MRTLIVAIFAVGMVAATAHAATPYGAHGFKAKKKSWAKALKKALKLHLNAKLELHRATENARADLKGVVKINRKGKRLVVVVRDPDAQRSPGFGLLSAARKFLEGATDPHAIGDTPPAEAPVYVTGNRGKVHLWGWEGRPGQPGERIVDLLK